MKFFLLAIIVMHSTCCADAATSVCSDAIAKAVPGAQPTVDKLSVAVMEQDIESVCLLLKAGKDVNEKARWGLIGSCCIAEAAQ